LKAAREFVTTRIQQSRRLDSRSSHPTILRQRSSQSAIPPESSGTLDGFDATILEIRTAGLLDSCCSDFAARCQGRIPLHPLRILSSRLILGRRARFSAKKHRKRSSKSHIPLSVYFDLVESRPALGPSRPDVLRVHVSSKRGLDSEQHYTYGQRHKTIQSVQCPALIADGERA
jgi:hypothetical protein